MSGEGRDDIGELSPLGLQSSSVSVPSSQSLPSPASSSVEFNGAGFLMTDHPTALPITKQPISCLSTVLSPPLADAEDVDLPDSALMPESTGGLKHPLMCLTQARYGISWGAVGAAMACFDEALSYSKERVMFGGPIGGKQIQQVRLADMLTQITHGQLVSYRLGRMKDEGTMTPQQVSLAKRANCSMATDIAREARRLLGGNGILVEYHSMRHMANLESVYTYEGTDDIHALILGQKLTGLNAF